MPNASGVAKAKSSTVGDRFQKPASRDRSFIVAKSNLYSLTRQNESTYPLMHPFWKRCILLFTTDRRSVIIKANNRVQKEMTVATRPNRTESEHVRRKQLLDAARKVFRDKGYEGATVSEIAQEAGLGKGTFYFYYPSKVAIAVALRDGLMTTIAAAVEIAMKPKPTFGEKLNTLVVTTFEVARQNVDLYRLAFIGADETHPELHSESPEHVAVLTTVTNLFTEATETGEMKTVDPEITARLVLGLLQQAVIEAFVSGHGHGGGDESERLEQGVQQFLANALVRQN